MPVCSNFPFAYGPDPRITVEAATLRKPEYDTSKKKTVRSYHKRYEKPQKVLHISYGIKGDFSYACTIYSIRSHIWLVYQKWVCVPKMALRTKYSMRAENGRYAKYSTRVRNTVQRTIKRTHTKYSICIPKTATRTKNGTCVRFIDFACGDKRYNNCD